MSLDSEASSKARLAHLFTERIKLSTELAKRIASATHYLMGLTAKAVLLKDNPVGSLSDIERATNASIANAINTAETSDWKP